MSTGHRAVLLAVSAALASHGISSAQRRTDYRGERDTFARVRPGLHVFLVVLLAELALLASQFQVGCDGPCTGFRRLVAALTVPLAVAWLALFAWGLVRLVRARFR